MPGSRRGRTSPAWTRAATQQLLRLPHQLLPGLSAPQLGLPQTPNQRAYNPEKIKVTETAIIVRNRHDDLVRVNSYSVGTRLGAGAYGTVSESPRNREPICMASTTS